MKKLIILTSLFLTSCSFGIKVTQNQSGKLEYSTDSTIAPLISFLKEEHKTKEEFIIDRKIRFFSIAPIPGEQQNEFNEKSEDK